MNSPDLLSAFILFGVFQGAVLVVALNRKTQRKSDANRILSFFLIIVTVTLSAHWLYIHNWILRFPHIALLLDNLFFLYGPLFYLFVDRQLYTEQRDGNRVWLHFIPAGIFIASQIPYALMPPGEYLRLMLSGRIWQYPYDQALAIIHIAVYLFLSWRLVSAFKRENRNEASFQQRVHFLEKVILVLAICWILWVHSFAITVFGFDFGVASFGYSSLWAMLSMMSCALGYYAISQPELFRIERNLQKYEGSPLTSEQIDSLRNKIQKAMAESKPYLKNELTLDDLSQLVGANKKDISRVINEKFDVNFFDFVNKYRVEEFKKLATPQALKERNILAIALDAGFNSKSAFNTVFKRLTHQTPSSYLKT